MSFLTDSDINAIMAMANVLATKRVRRFAVRTGRASPRETIEGVNAAIQKAEHELKCYLMTIKDGAYFIVDDFLLPSLREGYEVLHGNPFDAVGVEMFQSEKFGDCVAYVKKHIKEGEPVYRVKLERRHGAHSFKLINMEKA